MGAVRGAAADGGLCAVVPESAVRTDYPSAPPPGLPDHHPRPLGHRPAASPDRRSTALPGDQLGCLCCLVKNLWDSHGGRAIRLSDVLPLAYGFRR
ncbi:hypothetical protein AB0C51_21300 [Streptomyces pathocidini]|uniref:hypothetical protein n=1 Tax=Streptomyces pathocidini TaxID=1650571 RepID=UPI0033F46BD0